MDERVINELIKQLTENLERVESTREQVENTVQAYDALKTDVSKYTTELSFITQNVRTMISQLEEMKEKFLGNISSNIVKEIKGGVTSLTNKTDGVAEKIAFLDELVRNKSKDINDNIKNRFDTTDTSLFNIRALLNDVDAKVESCSKQITQTANSVQSLADRENKHFDTLKQLFEEQEKRFDMEFDVVRKQNKIYFFVIIVLLIAIGCLIYFNGRI